MKIFEFFELFEKWHKDCIFKESRALSGSGGRESPDDSDHPWVRANTEPDCLKIKGRVNSRKIGKAYLVERSKKIKLKLARIWIHITSRLIPILDGRRPVDPDLDHLYL